MRKAEDWNQKIFLGGSAGGSVEFGSHRNKVSFGESWSEIWEASQVVIFEYSIIGVAEEWLCHVVPGHVLVCCNMV